MYQSGQGDVHIKINVSNKRITIKTIIDVITNIFYH